MWKKSNNAPIRIATQPTSKGITIKDVCRGTLFFTKGYVSPYNALMEVVDIEYNKNAGKSVKDMWGGTVWEEPFASIKARNTITDEISGYSVQTENSVLSDWLTFVKDREEYERLVKSVDITCNITINLILPSYSTDEDIRREVKLVLERGDYNVDIRKA